MIRIIGARMRLQRREDFLHIYCSRAVETPSGSPQHSLTHTLVALCLTSGFWPWELQMPEEMPTEALLAMEVGEMVDKYPDSLLLQLENSVLLLLTFPKVIALQSPPP